MDIINELPQDQFNNIDDLLAFVSIYDDEERTNAYYSLLDDFGDKITEKYCVEAGCGFGLLAERMAQLGAKKVYAVEANPHLFDIAAHRLSRYSNIQVIHSDIRNFVPDEIIDVLVHDFFGQLVFDEDIYVLDQLLFSPKYILPNRALLKMSLLSSEHYVDDVVSPNVVKKLDGALVSGLFEENDLALDRTILQWQPGEQSRKTTINLSGQTGDLLCFGLEIYQNDKFICRAGVCENWSLVWTPRSGDEFTLEFKPSARGTEVHIDWICNS